MMRAAFIGIVWLLLAAPAWAEPPSADAVTGVWLVSAGDGYVQIFEEDGRYHGKTVGAPPGEGDPDAKDEHNPDPKKRDRDLLGIRILEGFEYDGDGEWVDGRAYDPDNGKTYDAKMWLEEPDTLKLRGYIGISLIGRTETWTRAGEDAPGIEEEELVAPAGE